MYYVRTHPIGSDTKELEDKLNEVAKSGAKLVGLTTTGNKLLVVLEVKDSSLTTFTSIRSSGSENDNDFLSFVKRATDMASVPTASGSMKVPAKLSPSKSNRRKS